MFKRRIVKLLELYTFIKKLKINNFNGSRDPEKNTDSKGFLLPEYTNIISVF